MIKSNSLSNEFIHSLSKIPAAPIPVPIHIEITPYFLAVLSSSWKRVTTCLDPVLPRGCPIAMAPPLGFNFSLGIPKASMVIVAYDANASLISKTSISLTSRPAFFKAAGIATAGPIPMISGGTPATANETILP